MHPLRSQPPPRYGGFVARGGAAPRWRKPLPPQAEAAAHKQSISSSRGSVRDRQQLRSIELATRPPSVPRMPTDAAAPGPPHPSAPRRRQRRPARPRAPTHLLTYIHNPKLTHAAVTTCTELAAAFTTINGQVAAMTEKAKLSYSVELSCDLGSSYSDCPPTSTMGPDWAPPASAAGLSVAITVKGAKGCTGAKRPLLSGGDPSTSINILTVDESLLKQTTSLKFTLADLVFDGTLDRSCVYIMSATGIVSYTQKNVDILNGIWVPGFSWGTGLAIEGNVKAKITGGLFKGNVAGQSGAAVYYAAASNSKKGSLSISGVRFTENTVNENLAKGGAVYVLTQLGAVVSSCACVCVVMCVRFFICVLSRRRNEMPRPRHPHTTVCRRPRSP